ncbi:ParB/RepB/Spo0J family partition protein [Deinococcus ruber]|uniref:ParB-like N-terminal domain-containing protein n=1 Tax=Deinococcus ruber TaxID=1848197 RepID=A0A918F7Q4_9DEIO|nr:ParB N-terminal domain-containing protein [Deinococcus ruber]GGR13172.1 hypothetical protein GCM10008957_27660 [Deinococcus ruber]
MTTNTVPLLTVSLPVAETQMIALSELQENTRGATNFLKHALRCSGQLDAILIEVLPSGEYVIRDGNRRVETARALGWTEIRADLYSGLSEGDWALLLSSVHNRSENPVEEARNYRVLLRSLTPEGIAANTGHPLSRIKARLELLKLPDDVLELVGSDTLALSVAERASKLKGPFLGRAVNEIRIAAGNGKRYGAKDLKEVTVARSGALGALLMAAAPPPVSLIPPAEVLALEVRELCARRNVDIAELLTELGLTPAGAGLPARQHARMN